MHTSLGPPSPALEPKEGDHEDLKCSKAQGFEVGGDAQEAVTACPPAERRLAESQSGSRETKRLSEISSLTGLLVRTNKAPCWPRNCHLRPLACQSP